MAARLAHIPIELSSGHIIRAPVTFGTCRVSDARVVFAAMETEIRKDSHRRSQLLTWLGLASLVGLFGLGSFLYSHPQIEVPHFVGRLAGFAFFAGACRRRAAKEKTSTWTRVMTGTDLLLVEDEEPALGSHVITPRRGYLHHGIYIGAGTVVHYAGLASGLRRGPVEEISLTRFSSGRPVWIRFDAGTHFESREVIRRARSRVGEHRYRLLTNNCEHFCEWCLRGENRSYQVEAWLARPGRALKAAIRMIARPLSPPGSFGLMSARSAS